MMLQYSRYSHNIDAVILQWLTLKTVIPYVLHLSSYIYKTI